MPPRFARHWYRFDLADYEWSVAKEEENLAKHGMDFSVACRIFEHQILRRRDTRVKRETVFQAIGETGGRVLFVAFTIRDHKCRLISARVASSDETAVFYEQ